MSEGEVVEQLVSHTDLLLSGLGVFFTILSVYLAGLNFVLSEESLFTRCLAFVFLTTCLLLLGAIVVGAQVQHAGLIARLHEIQAEQGLTAVGKALLANADAQFMIAGRQYTIDSLIMQLVWFFGAVVYAALFYLTFGYRWNPSDSRKALR